MGIGIRTKGLLMPIRMKSDISAEFLRSFMSYDPETGLFIRMVRAGPRGGDLGSVVASQRDNCGYLVIKILGRYYAAHRLAWLSVFGEWPKEEIDHVNGDRADNRIANLRGATRSQNNRNTRLRKDNKIGLKGMSARPNGRYQARIRIDKKTIWLGTFDTPEEANAVYASAAIHYFGEFARVA